jgi:GH43 family beta-xylosidase
MKLLTTLALGLLTLSDYVLARKYSNPLKPNEGGDPDIEFHDGYYYLVATNYRDLRQTRATTLEGLKTGEQRLVHDPVNDPEDARCQIWAPEQHQIDGM